MKRLPLILTSLAVAALTLPVAAFAGSDPSDGTAPSGSGAGTGGQVDGGDLPFTGLNLAIILIAAAVLIAMGVVLRRRASHHS